MEQEPWKPDVKNWKNITKDTVNLIIEECEKGLDAKVKSLESITSKANKILAIYISIFTSLCIYIIPKLNKIFSEYLPTVAFLSLCFSLLALCFCYKNIQHYVVKDLGYYPKKIVKSDYLDNNYSENEKYVAVAFVILRDIQARMISNDSIIIKRIRNNVKSLKMFLWIALSPLLGFVILYIKHLLVCYF